MVEKCRWNLNNILLIFVSPYFCNTIIHHNGIAWNCFVFTRIVIKYWCIHLQYELPSMLFYEPFFKHLSSRTSIKKYNRLRCLYSLCSFIYYTKNKCRVLKLSRHIILIVLFGIKWFTKTKIKLILWTNKQKFLTDLFLEKKIKTMCYNYI